MRGVTKKPKTGRAKKAAPAVTSSPIGRQNVILERIEEQQRVVIEAVTSNREALERKIEGLDQKLSSRIDVLAFAVRKNSTDIQALADKLDTKADAGRVSALEDRVEVLEASRAP